MRRIWLGCIGLLAWTGGAGAAPTDVRFQGPATITRTSGCPATSNPVRQNFTGSYSIPAPAMGGRNSTLAFRRSGKTHAFTLASASYANTYKSVTASRLFMPLDTYAASAKITWPAPLSIRPTTASATIYGIVKGWDGNAACTAEFRMDLVRVQSPPSPASWLPVDSLNRPADLYIDRINGRFYWNGNQYPTLIDLQQGLGATVHSLSDWSFPWTASAVTVMTEAYGGFTAGINRTLVQIDDGTDRNRLTIRKGMSSNLGAQVVKAGTTWMSQDTHTVVAGQTFRIAVGFGTNAGVTSQDGEAAKTDTTVQLPAVTTFRIGNNAVGSTPSTETLWKLAVWKSPLGAADVRAIADLHPIAWGEGDSYTGGAGGVSVMESLDRLTSRAVANRGIGGSTLASQKTRIATEVGAYSSVPLVHWDGDPNGYNADIRVDMANYAAIIASLGHSKFVIIAPLPRAGQVAAQRQRARDLTTALKAAYPGHVVDALPILLAMGDPATDAADIAAKVCPRSLLQDTVHLKRPAMDAVIANGVIPKLIPWISAE